ncbi:MAG TPA: hypothetical protein VFB10_07750 [Candidatus Dormibacteraeota bacterium]|nr:hypothetical protein [Candidatus Dormibacteraeota bacterium]
MKKTICIAAFGLSFIVAENLHAQAPPGPIQPDPSVVSSTAPPAPPVKRMEPRKNIMGKWKLNTDESDDPRQKSAQRSAGNSTGNPGGNGGPRMGWPGGGIGGGGMGGGHHGNNGSQNGTAQDRDRYNQLLDPSIRLDLERKNDKDPIVEMMGDQGRKTIFYTDGHKPDEPAGVGTEIVEAKWDGAKLVSDSTLPKNGSLKRTYELSPDGLQLWEEVEMVNSKDKYPVKFRFVYDAVAPSENY